MRMCDILNRSSLLCWVINIHCQIEFNKLFDTPIDEIKDVEGFLQRKDRIFERVPKGTFAVMSYNDFGLANEIPENIDLSGYFKKLKINQNIQNTINKNLFKENTLGLHIRKGDKVVEKETSTKNHFTSEKLICEIDEQYKEIISNIISNSDYNFYISSDDFPTVVQFKNTFGDRIIYRERESPEDVRSPDSIIEALIDLMLLSKTKGILYGIGSFAYTASKMLNTNRVNIMTGDNALINGGQSCKVAPLEISQKILEW
jgi:hypothetical protein